MSNGFWPRWTLKTEGAIMPDERLPMGQTVIVGLQHVVAMFGSTVLAPIIMGFDPNVAILFSGIATLLFFAITRGRVPSYLGSSFAFIGPVVAVAGMGPSANIPLALGGIVAAGAVYFCIGLIVQGVGHRWVEKVMPPIVTGSIVAAIGLVLAPIAISSASGITSANAHGDSFSRWVALATVLAIGLITVYAPGSLRRIPILLGGAFGYFLYYTLTNAGLCSALTSTGAYCGQAIDFSKVNAAAWFGLPHFTWPFVWDDGSWTPRFVSPVFSWKSVSLIAPVAIILVAENLGHIKAIGAMTGRSYDSFLGRAFMGDGLATMISGAFGGTGVTTYAENMGVMAVTRIYSTLIFVVAAIFALILGFSPKFGAVIQTIPGPVLGGLAIVVFGLIAATAGRIWVENAVSFADPRNLITAAVTLILGAGNFKLDVFGFELEGIGTATFGAIILYHLLGGLRRRKVEPVL